MCGIVGYIGDRDAVDVLTSGLKRLEYRGYDSAGVAVNTPAGIKSIKAVGKLAKLEEALQGQDFQGHTGIGHTRWATHGKPSEINAHPHEGPLGKVVLCHNGIIENHQMIRDTYLKGHTFRSTTDTEVAAHLLESFYEGDLLAAVQKMLTVLVGSFAMVIMAKDEPDHFIAVRKDSPLVIGLGEHEHFAASDIPAILSYTRRCVYLESGQMADVRQSQVTFMDFQGQEIEVKEHLIEWDDQAAQKGGYDHFMIKEIYEQPDTFQSVMAGRIQNGHIAFQEFSIDKKEINDWQQIYIVACGTAYHSGLVGGTILEKTLDKPVFVEVASEFRYRDPHIDDRTLVILISQSGETADTLAALHEAKAKGATTIAITNVVGSAIARDADRVLYLWAGPEISVASTKAYTSMLIALFLLGLYLGDQGGTFHLDEHQALLEGLLKLPQQAADMLTDSELEKYKAIAEIIKESNDLFYIGRGMDWAVAQEGALKLKEISYIHAEAYAAGELKHGTLALVTPETPVFTIALQENTFDKTISNASEVISREAPVWALVKEGTPHLAAGFEQRITIPDCDDFLAPILAALPLQLIAYYTAKARGCDIDQPRNLAKSVTVE